MKSEESNPERWQRVEELFESALAHRPEERSAFLVEACGGDEALRKQVQTLLESYEQAGSFIESHALGSQYEQTLIDDPSLAVIGRRIGSYKIVREIGRGGMGSVYLAMRADSEFQKRVAIKLIKRGMDTDFIIRRFRNERQILASLDHPYIGRLLDGGTTEDGLPYFVMEYVEGQPIHYYCDTQRLSIRERLDLFMKVCAAVQYAHQNLIIHRDLKPSNILVTADGTPKLLDFGIAKLLNPEIGSQTLDPTTAALRLMTPEYASPEQVRGESATAASDVYALGVMLYEILTDHRPYRLHSHFPQELARVICEQEPERPSIAINAIEVLDVENGDPLEITPETVSRARNTSLEELRRQLSGSLDNIVLKALRKEPQRRYHSVEQMAEDIRRYMDGQPVSAPSYFPLHHSGEVRTEEPSTGPRSIAVLPFKVLHIEEKSDDYLGMGMADAIITKLSNIHRITVRPTSAVLKYFDGEHNVVAAGYELNVGYVLDGRIQRAADRVRVTVQLVRVRDGAPVWASKFDENFTDIFTVEDSISEQVAQSLIPRLTGEELEVLHKRETDDAGAYDAYLRGRFFWNKFSDEGLEKALEHFREAIGIDPDYAMAYVGIADYYNWSAIYGLRAPKDSFPQAKAAAKRALELNDSLGEAYAALAFSTMCFDWDWTTAEQYFMRSLELNSNYAPTHQWYSNLLTAQGRFDEGIAAIRRAQEINPLSLMDRSITGWTYYHARQFEQALEELRKTLELDANFPNGYFMMGGIYGQLGRYDEAIQMAGKSLELMPGSVVPLWVIGYAYAMSQRQTEARGVLAQLESISQQRYVSPYFFALIQTGLGDTEAAFEWLEKAFESRDEWLVWLNTEPKLDPLRSDTRFESLLSRVGFSEEAIARAATVREQQAHRKTRVERTSAPLQPPLGDHLHLSGEPSGYETPVEPVQVAGSLKESRPTAVAGRGRSIFNRRALMLIAGLLVLSLAALAGFYLYQSYKKPVLHFQNTRIVKLTTIGNVTNAAISPDGKYVAYVTDEGGKQGLWGRQVNVSNSRRIVPPAEFVYRGLTFSHDGTYVYYTAADRKTPSKGALYQVPAYGGSESKVRDGVDSPVSFSPDGKQFAFIRSFPERGEEGLMIAETVGSAETQVAARKFPEHFSLSNAPAFSPDGLKITCGIQSSDLNGFYMRVLEVEIASRAEKFISEKRWSEVGQTAWMPDGSGLLMTAQDPDSSFMQIWFVSYPDGQARRLVSDLNDYRGVGLPASGASLLSVQRQTLTTIWTAPRNDLMRQTQITSGAGRYVDLSWTSDGKLLYASDAGGNADIWIMDGDGTNQRQLSAGAGRNYAPVASPDGRFVVFHSNRSGNWQIWRMNADGSNQMQLTGGDQNSNWPQISPDGQWVIYEHIGSGTLTTLWKIPIEGGTPSRLTDKLSMRPAISPDGKFVACWMKEDEPNAPWHIAVVQLVDAQLLRLFEVPQNEADGGSSIHWTPDGRAFIYIDFSNNVTNLLLQPLEGGTPQRLTNYTRDQFYSFDLSRDEKLVLARGLLSNDVVLLTEATSSTGE
ncbi:MAG TPA: protein kinase [Pyrinomonadaceae bacterium]|jgi:serine/threonine protein kinase/tetratricopeptide (TPR) repeat protein/WD40 repeat protein